MDPKEKFRHEESKKVTDNFIDNISAILEGIEPMKEPEHNLSTDEEIKGAILGFVKENNEKFGRGTLVQVLVGKKSTKVAMNELHKSEFFGCVSKSKEDEIDLLIEKLLDDKKLIVILLKRRYPVLSLV